MLKKMSALQEDIGISRQEVSQLKGKVDSLTELLHGINAKLDSASKGSTAADKPSTGSKGTK